MAGDEVPRAESGFLSSTSSQAERELIDKELRENGHEVSMDGPGYAALTYIGFTMQVSPIVARGRFVVGERSCQPFGVLHGGITAHVAESIVSYAATIQTGKRVAGLELNVNHLRATQMGQEVTVIAKPLMQGGRIQVWEVKFETEKPKKSESQVGPPEISLNAIARLTLIVGLPMPGLQKAGSKSTITSKL